MPWNFPVWQVVRFLAPGLMAGNVCLLKHATNVPRCADALVDAGRAAGLPAGVFDVLHIDNAQAAAVIADPRIAAVTLTGSERAGRSVAATAGQHLKKCVLELGGSDPLLVLEDADIARAVQVAIASRYGNAGQTCIAAKRFILVERAAPAFTEAFVAAVRALQPGDPCDPSTPMAPMARADLRVALDDQVRRSVGQGARVLVGGAPVVGHACAYPGTVLDAIDVDNVAFQEELFGPVASLVPVRDAAEAVARANASRFGLAATVFSADRERAEAIARQLDVGSVFVNAQVRSDVRLPFGGTKASGFGRELAAHGMHEFMNIKSVWVD
jgi:succinate-semialdehyde dehydrogenase/glutarate-semialdehyde dehydrogenase